MQTNTHTFLSCARLARLGFLFSGFALAALGCKPSQSAFGKYEPAPEGQQIAKPATSSTAIAPRGGPYQPERTRVFDLVHTRLELEPIWDKRQMKGLATVVLTPHVGSRNVIELDAKGMQIASVKRVWGKTERSVKYDYDGNRIRIVLDSAIAAGRLCTLEIDYLARPEALKRTGKLDAIEDDRGLYFINPDGKVPNRPRELWTQGEPESNSVWFPTIEATNQKSTQELLVTVEDSLITLSNGLLVSQTKLAGGKRQDVWEMTKPHAPYLFMLAVGPFAVVKDKWRNAEGKDIEVSYYVEKRYAKYARNVFGKTPEMMDFFSKKLGVAYPWPKYSQVIVRDYVSGAMENTTATIVGEDAMGDERLLAENDWELTIAHELFHHWFGDLVTAESWANLSLNESFAEYSETLWTEHAKGQDEADLQGLGEKIQYLYESRKKREPLIRFHYNQPLEMFDSHTYQKGGRILHMLRHYLGDDIFFASLKLYLTKFAYKKAEAQDLRLCFEEVSGQDLNWFFDQWYYKPGHPQLTVRKTFTGENLLLTVIQTQDTTYTPIYRLPVDFDVWVGDRRERHSFVCTGRDNTFEVPMTREPNLVMFDPDFALLAETRYEMRPDEQIAAYQRSPRAITRAIAIDAMLKGADQPTNNTYFRKGAKDGSRLVRRTALEAVQGSAFEVDAESRGVIENMAKQDADVGVRTLAISVMGQLKYPNMKEATVEILEKDQAYSVQAEALKQYAIAGGRDDKYVKRNENSISPRVVDAICEIYEADPKPEYLEWYQRRLHDPSRDVQTLVIESLGTYVHKAHGELKSRAQALLDSLKQYEADSPTIKAALPLAAQHALGK